jgi:YegS/Rv2252/BmrU family lipid kinase
MTRKIVAIVNPVSGRQTDLQALEQVRRALERHDSRLDVEVTSHAGHATELARRLPDDVHAVLAVGGDGTISEVVNGLIGRALPLVIWPSGTENLLARELAMPRSPERVARLLLEGEPFDCDVGVFNDRHFLAMAGVGFDAECVRRMTEVRRGNITHLDYFWPIWKTFWTYRFPVLRVEVDDQCVFEDRGLVFVGVIARYAVGLRILSEARYDDGLLDVCVIPCRSRASLLRQAVRVLLRRHRGRGGVVYRQCRRVRISSPKQVPVELDGELAGSLPAACSILPGAARFLRFPVAGDRAEQPGMIRCRSGACDVEESRS